MSNQIDRNLSGNSMQFSLKYLLRELKVPFTNYFVTQVTSEHPDFPSLLCMSDVLKDYKVENVAFKLAKNDLDELTTPLIAHLQDKDSEFVVVTKINDKVTYKSIKGDVTLDKRSFLKKASGAFLLAESSSASVEPNLKLNQIRNIIVNLRTPSIIAFTLSIVSIFLFWYTSTYDLSVGLTINILLLIKFIGFLTCAVLVAYTINKNTDILNRLCSSNKQINCNTILDSPAAKLFGLISWSDIGLVYFASTFFALAFAIPLGITLTPVLSFITLLALPYTFYSVYYQVFVAKKICSLCLLIQFLLWAEFVFFLATGTGFQPITQITALLFLVAVVSLVMILYLLIRPVVEDAGKYKMNTSDLNTFKYNSDVFKLFSVKNDAVNINENVKKIIFGRRDAPKEIVVVTNPLCGPCAEAHLKLEKILEDFKDEIRVVLVFAINPYSEELRNTIAKHMAATYFEYGENKAKQAIHEWYSASVKDYDSWSKKYPVRSNNEEVETLFYNLIQWNINTVVTFTPAIFIDEYQMALEYSVDDLKYFVRNLD